MCAALIQVGASTSPQIFGQTGGADTEMGVAPRLSAAVGSQSDLGSTAFVTAPTSNTANRPYIVLLP